MLLNKMKQQATSEDTLRLTNNEAHMRTHLALVVDLTAVGACFSAQLVALLD